MANTAVTISKTKVSLLPLPERAMSGFTHKFHVDYTDVNSGTGSADTVTMTLGTTPGTFIAPSCFAQVTTAFAGTTAFTMIVGTTSSATCLLTSTSVLAAGAITNTGGIFTPNSVANAQGTAAVNLTATFTNATGGSPSALSAGALDIYVCIFDPTKLDVSTTA